MSRLIDADALLEKIKVQADEHQMAKPLTTYAKLVVLEAPTIDAEPVVYGEWIVHNPDNPLTIYGECPFCHEEVGRKYNYCPNCGARLDS